MLLIYIIFLVLEKKKDMGNSSGFHRPKSRPNN